MVTIEDIKRLNAQSVSQPDIVGRYPRMTDADLEQYARRTTKRPLLCFAFLASTPFLMEVVCRLLGAW
jgi:hypothetical protein